MKKLFAAMFAVCLGFAFFAFAGCAAAPTEEDFTAAQDALDNYTVVVEFKWEDGGASRRLYQHAAGGRHEGLF